MLQDTEDKRKEKRKQKVLIYYDEELHILEHYTRGRMDIECLKVPVNQPGACVSLN